MERIALKGEDHLPEATATLAKQQQEETPEMATLYAVLEKSLTPQQQKLVKAIGFAIGATGISIPDACIRSKVPVADMRVLMEQIPEVAEYFQLKQIEYKYQLLKIITNKATQEGDVKLAMWLLEKQYANEFDSSVKKDIEKMKRGNDEDVVEMAILTIRRNNANSVPVNESSGAATTRETVRVIDVQETLAAPVPSQFIK